MAKVVSEVRVSAPRLHRLLRDPEAAVSRVAPFREQGWAAEQLNNECRPEGGGPRPSSRS
jgi:hypothetical protein